MVPEVEEGAEVEAGQAEEGVAHSRCSQRQR